jgi:hypothetical protein
MRASTAFLPCNESVTDIGTFAFGGACHCAKAGAAIGWEDAR